MDFPQLQYLKVIGETSVNRATKLSLDDHLILIVGPTGAGKSSFIEVFAERSQTLSISKDQLAGYTQEVSAYQIANTTYSGRSVHLIDSPGFADTKLSDNEIMGMIRKWLNDNERMVVNTILYLIPINAPRLAGSKRRTIEMLRTLLGNNPRTAKFNSIVFVTTMWDTLTNERAQKRAELNFAQLRDDVLKDFIAGGAEIQRFLNTKESALSSFDYYCWSSDAFFQIPVASSPHHENLYQDLHSRIESALQAKKIIENDLAQSDTQAIPELVALLDQNHSENQQILKKFIAQFITFGDPPDEFRDAAKNLRQSVIANSDIGQMDSSYSDIFDIWRNNGHIPHDAWPDEFGDFSDDARAELKWRRELHASIQSYYISKKSRTDDPPL